MCANLVADLAVAVQPIFQPTSAHRAILRSIQSVPCTAVSECRFLLPGCLAIPYLLSRPSLLMRTRQSSHLDIAYGAGRAGKHSYLREGDHGGGVAPEPLGPQLGEEGVADLRRGQIGDEGGGIGVEGVCSRKPATRGTWWLHSQGQLALF